MTDDESGGEAYIPFRPNRERSLEIWAETARRFSLPSEHKPDEDGT